MGATQPQRVFPYPADARSRPRFFQPLDTLLQRYGRSAMPVVQPLLASIMQAVLVFAARNEDRVRVWDGPQELRFLY